MIVVEVVFWVALGALVWTHAAYPLAAALARPRPAPPVRGEAATPSGDGDRRRLQRGDGDRAPAREPARARLPGRPARDRRHLGRLDRPHATSSSRRSRPASPASADPLPARRQGRRAGPGRARDERRDRRLLRRERDLGARTRSRKLVRSFADPDVAYVCGRLVLDRRGRLEPGGRLLALRDRGCATQESALGSVTGGNGSIYAVRRADYVEVDPRFGHDLSLPYLMVQRGRRAVYDPEALAFEKPTPENRDRVPAQGADVRALLADRAAREDAPPPAGRLPRRDRLAPAPALRQRPAAPGRLLGTNVALVALRAGVVYDVLLGLQLAFSGARPRSGRGLPRYYALVTWATVVSLWNYLRRGVPATWEAAEGTR